VVAREHFYFATRKTKKYQQSELASNLSNPYPPTTVKESKPSQ
jgi:hypothetical protein